MPATMIRVRLYVLVVMASPGAPRGPSYSILLDVPEHRNRACHHAAEAARRGGQRVLAEMDVRAVLHRPGLQVEGDLLARLEVGRAGEGVAQALDLGIAWPAEVGLVAGSVDQAVGQRV